MGRRTWLAGFVVSLAVMVAPALAVVSADATVSLPRPPLAPADQVGSRHVSVGRVLAGITDVTNGAQILDAERALLEQSWGVALPALPHIGPAPGSSTGVGILVRMALGSGAEAMDVNGDGLTDLITQESSADFTTVFTAVAGNDGRTLWSHTLPGYTYGVIVPDVNGDAVSDLLTESYLGGSYESTSTTWRGDTDYITAMRSGRTGEALWSERHSSSFSSTRETKSGLIRNTITTKDARTSVVVVPSWAGDINGDGLGDVVVNRVDLTDTFTRTSTAGILTRTHRQRVASSRGSVRSGAAAPGSFFTREALNEDGTAWLSPAGHLDGGPTADLLWDHTTGGHNLDARCIDLVSLCAYKDDGSVVNQLTAIAGSAGADMWTRTTSPPANARTFNAPLESDLTGDGGDDVVLLSSTFPPLATSAEVVSGRDGVTAWKASSFPSVLGSIDGGPGQDVLLQSSTTAPDGTATATFARVDGATGNVLFSTTRSATPPENGGAYVYGLPLADVDGDGVTDISISRVTYARDPDVGFSEYRFATEVESGTAPTVLYTVPDGSSASAGGDLDGDGAVDILVATYVTDPDGTVHSATVARSVRTGAELWTRTIDVAAYWTPIADATGDGRDDIVEWRYRYDQAANTFHSGLAVLDGSSGTLLWHRGEL